ncbi:hypothetical protein M0802_001357 [Mischocyttarus mexicanus]|nr:hypothetical protein M0802_001357 [Mischocyttarus mexicanus]
MYSRTCARSSESFSQKDEDVSILRVLSYSDLTTTTGSSRFAFIATALERAAVAVARRRSPMRRNVELLTVNIASTIPTRSTVFRRKVASFFVVTPSISFFSYLNSHKRTMSFEILVPRQ